LQHALSAQYLLAAWANKEARRRVEFTGVELIGNAEIIASWEKAMTGSVEKAVTGLHIVRVERELCAGRSPL
jgi:hypothetical protein